MQLLKVGITNNVYLKSGRKELKMTLEQVDNKVGVDKSTVRKWETGTLRT